MSIQTFQDRVADAPLAASQITVPIGEAKAVAAVLADLPGPLSDERFWQESAKGLACQYRAKVAVEDADKLVAAYLHRYGKNPEPASGHPLEGALEVKREFPEPVPEPTAADEIERVRQHLGSYSPRPSAAESPEPDKTAMAEIVAAAVEPQPERRELEWKWGVGSWTASSRLSGDRPYWMVELSRKGLFIARLVLSVSRGVVRHEASTWAAAQAWCQEQENKLLAEGEPWTWHYFPDGHNESAACGLRPIGRGRHGPTEVSKLKPDSPFHRVCASCANIEAGTEPLEEHYELVEPQPKRRGLEWKPMTGDQQGWTADSTTTGEYKSRFWSIWITEDDGLFRSRQSWLPQKTCDQPTLALAKAWCEDQEAKLLAQQEGPEDA